MKVYHPEFLAMHDDMAVWCKRQEAEGWQSPEVEKWAMYVRKCLWEAAYAENASGSLKSLVNYSAKLEAAKDQKSDEPNGHAD